MNTPVLEPDATATGVGRSFGTFGELLQGVLPEEDQDFLVTFPIERWTTAVFRPNAGSHEVTVRPAYKEKSRLLVKHMLEDLEVPWGGELTLHSDLPVGKGFASSSADLVASARAVADALGRPLDAESIEGYLRCIEPSDGVMYPGVVSFYHRSVRLKEELGVLPPLTILAHDQGGEVDTLGFNQIPKPFDHEDKLEYSRLLAVLGAAVREGDLRTVGQVATKSAFMNAKLRPHAALSAMERVCREVDGLGLVLAHSGTMLGILLPEQDPEHSTKIALARRLLASVPGSLETYRSLGPDTIRQSSRPHTFEGTAHAL
ncbi:kinase [Streptomyces sp. NPDC089799]|uniref:GHMP family kinase ATP-binding protein n=1 Tax=Streptomyces sp. NPDC089799 TaxID=3155066 RepID=UPI00342D6682